ncbi:MAG TPA: arsenate reductase ArsC [Candidatus Nitrosopolaris rasttigaisensis]|nr:arsenate reductase ArsC [Candidatus Nitrosopolaris rasttigaisensis]
MRFFGSSKEQNNKKTLLFVCVQNAARSQIAEAFFRKYAPINYEALSAGTEPVGNLNLLAIEAMKEVGIDISNQRPKIITEDMVRQSTARVNMGCIQRESCPTLFIHNVSDWNIEDPKGKPLEKVREIRDVIESRVKKLVTGISQTSRQINF